MSTSVTYFKAVLKHPKITYWMCSLSLIMCSLVAAQDKPVSSVHSGAYLPGYVGVRDYASPGISGFMAMDYNIYLYADKFYDKHGNAVNSIAPAPGMDTPITVDLSGYANSFLFSYASPILDFLGGTQYMFSLNPTYATANIRAGMAQLNGSHQTIDGGASGFTDLVVAPIFLSKNFGNTDIALSYMFSAPTGKYKSGESDNIGAGYWAHLIQIAGYYYLDNRTTAFMIMPGYEFMGHIKDIDVRPGSRVILEYGISQYMNKNLELTLEGGHAWQVSRDTGDAVYWDSSIKDQTSLIAAGAGYWFFDQQLYTHLQWNLSYGNRQHFNANSLVLQIMLVPKKWTRPLTQS